ncbi:MAG TPA: GNAT family N-acetyltransferase [Candidatus Dormibacteraeota bacterium]|jgi:GNAT superfamily N-acetyltransferase
MGGEASLVRPRFARGVRAFAAMVDGAIAGYGWLSTRPEWIGEVQLEIRPGRGEAYLWNCATVPEHRRRGVFRALLTGISNHAQAEGLRRLWIGSVAIPAEKAVGPSGFRRVLTFSTWTLGPAHVLMSRPAADVDPRTVREARIVLGSQEVPMRLGLSVRSRIARIH